MNAHNLSTMLATEARRLHQQATQLEGAAQALAQTNGHTGTVKGSTRIWTRAQRLEVSKRMSRLWAKRRKQAA